MPPEYRGTGDTLTSHSAALCDRTAPTPPAIALRGAAPRRGTAGGCALVPRTAPPGRPLAGPHPLPRHARLCASAPGRGSLPALRPGLRRRRGGGIGSPKARRAPPQGGCGHPSGPAGPTVAHPAPPGCSVACPPSSGSLHRSPPPPTRRTLPVPRTRGTGGNSARTPRAESPPLLTRPAPVPRHAPMGAPSLRAAAPRGSVRPHPERLLSVGRVQTLPRGQGGDTATGAAWRHCHKTTHERKIGANEPRCRPGGASPPTAGIPPKGALLDHAAQPSPSPG